MSNVSEGRAKPQMTQAIYKIAKMVEEAAKETPTPTRWDLVRIWFELRAMGALFALGADTEEVGAYVLRSLSENKSQEGHETSE
ncbi:MAG: hypothetical protein QXT45_04990 [Candidatus Bilamarchaeaceae archaeon]